MYFIPHMALLHVRLTLPTYLPPISMESHNSLYGSFPILSKILAVTEGIATLARFDYHYIFTVINVPLPSVRYDYRICLTWFFPNIPIKNSTLTVWISIVIFSFLFSR